jgi:hypothetical protein
MLRWEAKEFEFKCQIFQFQDQRIKRLKVLEENRNAETEITMITKKQKGCQEYSLGPEIQAIRTPYEISKGDIFRGNRSLVKNIWKCQSRQVVQKEITEGNDERAVKWNQWVSIMTPQYLLMPIPFIEDPNLNFIISFSLDFISPTLLPPPPIIHQPRILHQTKSNHSLSLTISKTNWDLNPTWSSWITPLGSTPTKDSRFSHLDQLLPSFDPVKILPTSHFLIPALNSSFLPILLFLNSTHPVIVPVNYVHEINSATVCPTSLKTVDHSCWLLPIRVTAPYSCIDQFQRKQTNLLLSEAGDLALDETLFEEDSDSRSKQTFLESRSYRFILHQMTLRPIVSEIQKINHQLLPPQPSLDIIQHILSVSNQLIYINRTESKLSRNWVYQSLCDPIRIPVAYVPYSTSFQETILISKILDRCPPRAGAPKIFQEIDPLLYWQLDPNIKNSPLGKDTLSPEEDSNTRTPHCSSIETPMEVSFEESKSCEIVSAVEVKRRSPSPTVTATNHIESKTLENINPKVHISENQLPNLQLVEIDNSTLQPQQAHMDDIIDSYLQLHGFPSSSGPPNPMKTTRDLDQIHYPTTKICPPPPSLHSNTSRTTSHFTDPMESLKILVSEDLLVQNPIYSTLLSQKYKIQCVSAPLESPLAFIVDEITGICLLFDELFTSRERLKTFLRKLTSLVFKFNTIWLVIVSLDEMKVPHDIFASLCQSLTQFPCSVEIRFSRHLSVPSMIHGLCQEAATFVAVNKGVLLSAFKDRSMMELLENMIFSAHCKF